jgi:hypothetical protein
MVRGRARDMVADDLQFMGWLLGLETDRSVDGLSNSICQFLCSRPNGERDGASLTCSNVGGHNFRTRSVRIILLTNNAEKAIAMIEKNYDAFDKIIEQLMEEIRLLKQVKDSNDFQKCSNLVENLAVTVENVGKKSRFTSSIVIRDLLKKLPEYLRLQWGQYLVQIWSDDVDIKQFATWVLEQNDVISKVEIGNEVPRSDQRKSKMVKEIRTTIQEKYRTITKRVRRADNK